MIRACALSIASLSLLLFTGRLEAQVTMGDIQADYDAQKYQEVVRKTQTALNLKGNAAVGLDRAQLQVLRGESYLRLKQNPNAAMAFTAAVKETTDSTKAGAWTAMALLITRSPGGKYTPKLPAVDGTRTGPVDIVEAEPRKAAFAALFNDELKAAMPKIQAASRQASLPPLVEGMKLAGALRNLEVAATEKDDTVKELINDMGTRAAKLMGDEVKTMSTEVEKIATLANQTTTDAVIDQSYGAAQVTSQKRGLTTTDARALTEVVKVTGQVSKACDELSAAVGSDKLFASVKEDSARLSQRAYDVMNTSYSGGDNNVRIQRGRSGNR